MSMRRVRAIYRKEMREFRRHKQVISTMAVSPIGFLIFPAIFLFSVTPSDVSVLYNYPVQLFSLAMAAVLPAVVGAYSITGEREQGTLEPAHQGRPGRPAARHAGQPTGRRRTDPDGGPRHPVHRTDHHRARGGACSAGRSRVATGVEDVQPGTADPRHPLSRRRAALRLIST